ncbi:MAG TPA: hypothetical protein VGA13_09985 [Acidimicrobiales bacterium]
MRILEVALDGAPDPIELHPGITVVAGLDPAARRAFVEAVAELSSGKTPSGALVTIESLDIVMPADETSIAALGLGSDLDVVLSPHQLPSGRPDHSGGEPDPEHDLNAAIYDRQREEELEQAVEDARRRLTDARAVDPMQAPEVTAARRIAEEARAAVTTAQAEAERAAAIVDTLGPTAEPVDSEAAKRALDDAEAALAELEGAEPRPPDPLDDPDQDPHQLGHRGGADNVDGVVDGVVDEVVDEVVGAVERLRAAVGAPFEPVDRDGPIDDDPRVVAATNVLEEARTGLRAAERDAEPLHLDPTDVEALEQAYAAVEDSEERVARRVAGPGSKRRLKAAEQDLRTVLDRLGLPSYSAYLMRSSSMNVSAAARDDLRAASARAAEAEGRLEGIIEVVRAERLAASTQSTDEARARHDVAVADARDALVSLLDGRVELASGSDSALALAAATLWINQQREAEKEAAAKIAEWNRLTAAHQSLHDVWRRDMESAARRVLDARRALEAATRHASAQSQHLSGANEAHEESRRAADSLDAASAALSSANQELRAAESAAESAAVEAIAAREVELREMEVALARATGAPMPRHTNGLGSLDPDDLEVYVLARMAAQRSVGRAGSLPFVVDGAFDGLSDETTEPARGLVERMAASVQTVILSDDEALVDWAERLGVGRALAIRV